MSHSNNVAALATLHKYLYVKKPQVFLYVLFISVVVLRIFFICLTTPPSSAIINRKLKIKPCAFHERSCVENVSRMFPNFPMEFWMQVRNITFKMFLNNESCALFPDVLRLRVEDSYWQTIDLSNFTTLHMYSAYYDNRKISTKHNFVRILTMANKTNEDFPLNDKLFCHLWYDNEIKPVISPVVTKDYGWRDFWKTHQNGMEATYLLGCVVPDDISVPRAVSIVEKPCDRANNLLPIIYNEGTRSKNVTVCVKGLDFLQKDISLRLVEWIEFILLMGVDKIYFYQFELHPNVKKVIEYYANKDKVDVRSSTIPPGQPNIPYVRHAFLSNNVQKSLNEIILYNDCFYRLMYSYKYICLLDIDEIILPVQDNDWNALIHRLEDKLQPNEKAASLNVRNSYFLDHMTPDGNYPEVPPYMHMLQHIYRSENFTPPLAYVKSFFNTKEVLLCHNHLPFCHSNDSTFAWDVSLSDAQMNHYRSNLNLDLLDKSYGDTSLKDPILWRYKDILVQNTNRAISDLNL